jgi:transposase
MIRRNVSIFVSAAPLDMRRSFDGLAAAARETLKQDPESGASDTVRRGPRRAGAAHRSL